MFSAILAAYEHGDIWLVRTITAALHVWFLKVQNILIIVAVSPYHLFGSEWKYLFPMLDHKVNYSMLTWREIQAHIKRCVWSAGACLTHSLDYRRWSHIWMHVYSGCKCYCFVCMRLLNKYMTVREKDKNCYHFTIIILPTDTALQQCKLSSLKALSDWEIRALEGDNWN